MSHFPTLSSVTSLWLFEIGHGVMWDTEVNVYRNLEFCFGFVFFFFLIQFSRTPLVLSHKKFVT